MSFAIYYIEYMVDTEKIEMRHGEIGGLWNTMNIIE
jgi:hypothetical protein